MQLKRFKVITNIETIVCIAQNKDLAEVMVKDSYSDIRIFSINEIISTSKLHARIQHDLNLCSEYRDKKVLIDAYNHIKKLEAAVKYSADELEGWLKDQGSYGTLKYVETISEMRSLLKE